MKKFSVIIIIIILASLTVSGVSAYGWETYDYGIFNNQTYLYDIGGHFDNYVDMEFNRNIILSEMQAKYGITYVFVIVNDYNIAGKDDTVWDFAALIRENAGYGEDFICVAITTGPGERDFAIFTHGKGIAVMNDGYVDGMFNAVMANLRTNDWAGALTTFIDLAEKMTDSYYNDTSSVADIQGNVINISTSSAAFDVTQLILWIVFPGVLLAVILLIAEFAKHKPVKRATHADYYVEADNVNMSKTEDVFLRTRETRVKVSSSSSGGGGSGGGRSGGSTRTGSSGRSGGGRSGRF